MTELRLSASIPVEILQEIQRLKECLVDDG